MGKKKKALRPKVQRMKRPARLASARTWIPTFTGKQLLRGYCNHFAVDWRCAAIELEMLGIKIDPEYLKLREKAAADLVKARQKKKQDKAASVDKHWHPFIDPYSAYLAGDFEALFDLENREHEDLRFDEFSDTYLNEI